MVTEPVPYSLLFVFVPEDQTELTLVIQPLSRALRHAAGAEADSSSRDYGDECMDWK